MSKFKDLPFAARCAIVFVIIAIICVAAGFVGRALTNQRAGDSQSQQTQTTEASQQSDQASSKESTDQLSEGEETTASPSEQAQLLSSDANTVNTQQLPDSSFIYDTSIVDLAKADSYFDHQIVQVLGEVVGDRIYATADTQHCWITLDATNTDADATVAVYMTTEASEVIDAFGTYGLRGTMLQVRGTYHLACSEHQGISDIHAEYVSVVQAGEAARDKFSIASFLPGILLLVLGGLLVVLYARMREKER